MHVELVFDDPPEAVGGGASLGLGVGDQSRHQFLAAVFAHLRRREAQDAHGLIGDRVKMPDALLRRKASRGSNVVGRKGDLRKRQPKFFVFAMRTELQLGGMRGHRDALLVLAVLDDRRHDARGPDLLRDLLELLLRSLRALRFELSSGSDSLDLVLLALRLTGHDGLELLCRCRLAFRVAGCQVLKPLCLHGLTLCVAGRDGLEPLRLELAGLGGAGIFASMKVGEAGVLAALREGGLLSLRLTHVREDVGNAGSGSRAFDEQAENTACADPKLDGGLGGRATGDELAHPGKLLRGGLHDDATLLHHLAFNLERHLHCDGRVRLGALLDEGDDLRVV